MVESAEIVIIGGGVIGASVAYHLVEAGCPDVLILERESQQGLGSTGRATGGVRAQFATPINIQMSLYSIDFFTRFEEATGHPCGYRPQGYLFVATNQQHLDHLKEIRERQHALGRTNVEMLTTEDIAATVPQLRADDVVGGSFCQADGLINPLGVMKGFTARARMSGAQLSFGAEVIGIDVERGHVSGVRTTRGRVATRTIVCAAGAWAALVARLAGVEIPLVPLRRQIVTANLPDELPENLPMVVDVSNGFHFRRDSNAPASGVLMAWPDPDETPGFETTFTTEFIPKIRARARHRVPCFANMDVDLKRCRAGLYEMTPDRHAIIGRAPGVGGMFLVGGFSGHGVMHSPAAGRMVAEMILDGQSRFLDSTPLRPERFAENRLLNETTLL